MPLLRYSLIAIIAATLLFCSCEKSPQITTCHDAAAINNNAQRSCIYPKDYIQGEYIVTVVAYPLDPIQVGNQFDLSVRNTYHNDNTLVEMVWLQSALAPYDFAQRLDGNDFTLTNYPTWALAPLTGSGSFTESGTFTFSGIVHSQGGGDQPIVLQGHR